jgi:hypothetical protein
MNRAGDAALWAGNGLPFKCRSNGGVRGNSARLPRAGFSSVQFCVIEELLVSSSDEIRSLEASGKT